MKNRLFACIGIAVTLFSSCNRGELFSQFRQVKKSSWHQEVSLDFRLDSLPADPDKRYDFRIDIVSNDRYPYQNLWLAVEQNLADTAFVYDTLEVKLIRDDGKRRGSGGAGLYLLSVPYKQALPLDSTRTYLIRIRQVMRDESLKGIEKLGITVIQTDENRRERRFPESLLP